MRCIVEFVYILGMHPSLILCSFSAFHGYAVLASLAVCAVVWVLHCLGSLSASCSLIVCASTVCCVWYSTARLPEQYSLDSALPGIFMFQHAYSTRMFEG